MAKLNLQFIAGFLSCLLIVGCSGMAYRYYGLEGVRYDDGKLLGPSSTDDRPFADCAPNAQNPHPCVVMFADEFNRFKTDYLDTKNKLEDCQKNGSAP